MYECALGDTHLHRPVLQGGSGVSVFPPEPSGCEENDLEGGLDDVYVTEKVCRACLSRRYKEGTEKRGREEQGESGEKCSL